MELAKWNMTTTECFERKMLCDGCLIESYCQKYGYKVKEAVFNTFKNFGRPKKDEFVLDENNFPKLTEREKKIIEFMLKGFDDVEIATEFNVSKATIRNLLGIIYEKFDKLIKFKHTTKEKQLLNYLRENDEFDWKNNGQNMHN